MQSFHGEVGGGGQSRLPSNVECPSHMGTHLQNSNCGQNCQIILLFLKFQGRNKLKEEQKSGVVVASFSSKWSVLNEVFSGLWALSPLYFQMEVTTSSRVAHLAKSLNSLDPIWPAFASRLASMSRLSRLSRPEGTNTTAAIDDVSQIKYTPSARDHRSDTPGPQHVKIRSQMSRTRGHYPVPPDRNLTGTQRVQTRRRKTWTPPNSSAEPN